MSYSYFKRGLPIYYDGPIMYDESMVASCINSLRLEPFRENRNELQVKAIYQLSANDELLRGDNGDDFSKSEDLAVDILRSTGHIKKADSVRHGLTQQDGKDGKNECDIIINNQIQCEVVSEMSDTTGSKKLKRLEDKVLFTNTIDGIIYASKAIKSKLDAKQYCDDYEKHLFVIYAGTRENAIAMANSVKNHIIARGIVSKNFFTQIYMLRYDLISDQYFFCTTKNWEDKKYIRFTNKEPLVYRIKIVTPRLNSNMYYLLDIINNSGENMSPIVMKGREAENFMRKYGIRFA